jgi:hypothetical protein
MLWRVHFTSREPNYAKRSPVLSFQGYPQEQVPGDRQNDLHGVGYQRILPPLAGRSVAGCTRLCRHRRRLLFGAAAATRASVGVIPSRSTAGDDLAKVARNWPSAHGGPSSGSGRRSRSASGDNHRTSIHVVRVIESDRNGKRLLSPFSAGIVRCRWLQLVVRSG